MPTICTINHGNIWIICLKFLLIIGLWESYQVRNKKHKKMLKVKTYSVHPSIWVLDHVEMELSGTGLQIVFKRKQLQGNSPLASDKANKLPRTQKSKLHSRVPIERCPITALLIVNSLILLHCDFFCFCYERRLLGYSWTHRLSIYTYISFNIINGDFLTFGWWREKMRCFWWLIPWISIPIFLFTKRCLLMMLCCFWSCLSLLCFIMKPLKEFF